VVYIKCACGALYHYILQCFGAILSGRKVNGFVKKICSNSPRTFSLVVVITEINSGKWPVRQKSKTIVLVIVDIIVGIVVRVGFIMH